MDQKGILMATIRTGVGSGEGVLIRSCAPHGGQRGKWY
jgi:hypothetical protein